MVAATNTLARQLAAFLGQIHRDSQAEFFSEVAAMELSFSQVKALHRIEDAEQLTVKGLAGRLGLSLPAASRAVEGLVQRNLLDRTECPDDRRSRHVRLTDDGRKALARLDAARVAGLEEFVAGLSDTQRSALAAALQEVTPA